MLPVFRSWQPYHLHVPIVVKSASLILLEPSGRVQACIGIASLFTSYISVSQPPGRGPVPGPGINYTGAREVLLEFVIFVF
jgi:hypothetical protein